MRCLPPRRQPPLVAMEVQVSEDGSKVAEKAFNLVQSTLVAPTGGSTQSAVESSGLMAWLYLRAMNCPPIKLAELRVYTRRPKQFLHTQNTANAVMRENDCETVCEITTPSAVMTIARIDTRALRRCSVIRTTFPRGLLATTAKCSSRQAKAACWSPASCNQLLLRQIPVYSDGTDIRTRASLHIQIRPH